MTAHHIESAIDGQGIATITINRPEKRNAMTYAMLAEFTRAVGAMGEDPSVRVLIIAGAGGAFCAGTDLADLATIPGETRGTRGSAEEHEAWWPIVRCPKPVIAAIDGVAVGMGAEFTSQCDVRIASTRSRFAWNFAHRGLVPDTGAGSWILPRLIGHSRALRLLYSGAFLSAEEAHAIGYVAELVEPGEALAAARAEAARYLNSSPFSIGKIKALVYEGMGRDVAEHMRAHVPAIAACFKSEDHKEGVASFLEKRPAKFVGR
ncbi:MAG: enoyl-CoA hydratase/isomerase family protein [Alphaproteobacteria bacterium]|nr:enoyl-CoA hydratase/isomerase family protein [Alphaproteobacteria bacterium]